MKDDVLKILEKSYEILRDIKNWTQEVTARDANDECVVSTDKDACKFCSIGAPHHVAYMLDVDRFYAGHIVDLLNAKSNKMFGISVIAVNDQRGKSREECHRRVLEVYEAVLTDRRAA